MWLVEITNMLIKSWIDYILAKQILFPNPWLLSIPFCYIKYGDTKVNTKYSEETIAITDRTRRFMGICYINEKSKNEGNREVFDVSKRFLEWYSSVIS